MNAWCIKRNDYTDEEQQQLLDVAIYFGATEAEKAEQYRSSQQLAHLPYIGVDNTGQTCISSSARHYKDNLTTYNESFELVTGLKTRDAYIEEYYGKKYQVTPEQNEWLQKLVFSLGGYWRNGGTNILYTDEEYLFVYDDGCVAYCDSESYFNYHKLPLANLDEYNAELEIYEVEPESSTPQTSDIISTEELSSAAKELDLVFEMNSRGLTAFDRNDKEYSLDSREDFESLVDAMKVIKRLCNP